MTLADRIKPHVADIIAAHNAGDKQATDIIRLYEMHRKCQSDPGAPALCEGALEDWLRRGVR